MGDTDAHQHLVINGLPPDATSPQLRRDAFTLLFAGMNLLHQQALILNPFQVHNVGPQGSEIRRYNGVKGPWVKGFTNAVIEPKVWSDPVTIALCATRSTAVRHHKLVRPHTERKTTFMDSPCTHIIHAKT